jgi:hypothetical protein
MFRDLGVAEEKSSYSNARGLVGMQNNSGDTQLIVYTKTWFKDLGLIFRIFVLLVLIAMLFFRQPFSILPEWQEGPAVYQEVVRFELFTVGKWLLLMSFYLLFFVGAHVKNNIYKGLAGAEIFFTKHSKIVKSLAYGEKFISLDPRVRTYAIVSSKTFVVTMPEVGAESKNPISTSHSGSVLARITNGHKLLAQGGLEKFCKQLKDSYASRIKDLWASEDARDFNSFLIEPISFEKKKTDPEDKLEELSIKNLDTDFLNRLSEIDQLDISGLNLQESANPKRKEVVKMLQPIAENYGIKLLDYIPSENSVKEDFLAQLVMPRVSSILRLRQVVNMLKDITEDEIREEIDASVGDKKVGVLKVDKIIREIESYIEVINDSKTVEEIVSAKEYKIVNKIEGLLAPKLAELESLTTEIQSKAIDVAGLERYVAEKKKLIAETQEVLGRLVPEIETVIIESFNETEMIPNVDIIKNFFSNTGTNEALQYLKDTMEKIGTVVENEKGKEMESIENYVKKFNAAETLNGINSQLSEESVDSDLNLKGFNPDEIKKKVDNIAKEANIQIETEKSEEEESSKKEVLV